MRKITQNIKVNRIEQVRFSNGRHIVYTYKDDQKYLKNMMDFIIEGIEENQLIIYIDSPDRFEILMEELVARGFSETQLNSIIFNDSTQFYSTQDSFNNEKVQKNFADLVKPHLKKDKETRIWASVVWSDQDQETLKKQVSSHEYRCDCFVSGQSNVLVVCAYEALKLPTSFMNIILQTHKFHMTDTDLSISHLYKKEPLLLSRLSEQIKLEEAKENHVIRSEKLNMASKLAAITAHEIGNPLGVIKGFLQLIQEIDGVSSAGQQYLDTISRQVEKLEQVASEFLTLANPQLGNKKEVNLSQLIREVSELMEAEASRKAIKIEMELEYGKIMFFGDPVKIKQVLVHLIKNSIEVMEGGVITVKVKDLVEGIHIYVVDNGPGIPKHLIDQIGDPFVTTKESGTGLGLLLSKQIIAGHEGRLIVESEVGEGAIFTVIFPKNKNNNHGKRMD